MMEVLSYPDDGAKMEVARAMSKPTLREELENEQASLKERLILVSSALNELDAYPEVASVLETISKLRGIRY